MSVCIHCFGWGCTRCGPVTTYNPAQRCPNCGSELHAICGLGDQTTIADIELEALKADNARLRAALSALLVPLANAIDVDGLVAKARAALRGGQ